MKKVVAVIFLSSLLFVIGTSVQAQSKCKFNREGTDPITGISYKSIGAYFYHRNIRTGVITGNSEWIVNIVRSGDNYILSSQCDIEGFFEDKMAIGNPLILKLENNKIITLNAMQVLEPLRINVGGVNVVRYTSGYNIKIEDIELLSSAKVVFARITLGPRVRSENIKDKDAITLKKGVICLIQ
ncbi:MAG TPA: hypothetical protein PLG33_05400 [Prolixibacteraceae bacterium]|nr:hypothetical protein [Prolixibacteraceae bacterium]HPR85463.1 hypothetical protein [Prolixibacteraceae bacterium]